MKTTSKAKPQTKAQIITLPDLKKGEHYAGFLLDDAGKPSHHLILLPVEMKHDTWDAAVAFAKKCGGELPTRREQSLLFANLKAKFQPAYYWSGEQHADVSAHAWGQLFSDGNQGLWRKDNKFRARAVRRVSI